MIELFSFDKCSKSGAKFDYEKARWFNHEYIQRASDVELEQLFRPILDENKVTVSKEFAQKVIALVKNRAHLIEDFWEQGSFFFESPTEYDAKTVKKRWKEGTPRQMTELIEVLEGLDNFSSEHQETVVKDWIASNEYNMGAIMNAFRLALVGAGKGPHIFDITSLIGREETIHRLQKAITTIH
jgi:glutamyl-tRNA synthetase